MPINAIDIHGEDIYIITGNKAVKVAIETLRKTDVGRKLLEKYENSKTNDVYISAQKFKTHGADGYTIADAEKGQAIDKNGKINLKASSKLDQRRGIDFSNFDGVDVSKSKKEGKKISLISLNTETFSETKNSVADKKYNAEVILDEVGAHVDKYDGEKSDEDKEHKAIGYLFELNDDGSFKTDENGAAIYTVIEGSDVYKLRQELELVFKSEDKEKANEKKEK
jgi:hypothetical protein